MRPFRSNRRLWGSCVLALCAVAGAAFGLSGFGHLVEVPRMADAAVFISDEETLRPVSLSAADEASPITLLMNKPAAYLIPPFDSDQIAISDPAIKEDGRFVFAAGVAPVVEYIEKNPKPFNEPALFAACLDLAGTELFSEQLGHRLRLPERVRDLLALQLLTRFPEEAASVRLEMIDLPTASAWQANGEPARVQPLFFRLQAQDCARQVVSLLEEPNFTKLAAQKPDGYTVLVVAE